MDECSIKSTQTYMEFKGELDYELNRAANGFVRIGYLLRKARDTDILKDSPYTNVNDFAKAEYGLDTSQVSRFININDKFARPDDPEQLKDEYKGYGVAKLGLMLTLPGPIAEELSPEMSKADIQKVKEEYEAEQKITPIEVMVEEQDEDACDMPLLEHILYIVGEAEPVMMAALLKEEGFTLKPEPRKEMEILAPAGQKMYIARVPGLGKYSLNIKGMSATAINMRDGSKEQFDADEVSKAIEYLINRAMQDKEETPEIADAIAMWELIYKKHYQQIAPVQKKESRVSAAKPKEEKPAKLKEKKPEKKQESDSFMNEAEDPEEEPKDAEAEEEPKSSGIDQATLKGYKAGLKSDAHVCERLIDNNQFRALRTKLQSMVNTVGRIIDKLEG